MEPHGTRILRCVISLLIFTRSNKKRPLWVLRSRNFLFERGPILIGPEIRNSLPVSREEGGWAEGKGDPVGEDLQKFDLLVSRCDVRASVLGTVGA